MEFIISVTYTDMSTKDYSMGANSLDNVLFILEGGRSGVSTDNVLNMSITRSTPILAT